MPRFLKLTLITLLVFVSLSAASLGVAAAYYRDRFYPGVRVAGVQVGGLTEAQGKQKVAERVASYASHTVVVTIPDISKDRDVTTGQYPDIEVSGTAAELGLEMEEENAQLTGWVTGHQTNLLDWATSAIPTFFNGKNVPLVYSVDPAKADEFISTKVLPKLVQPVAATLKIDGDKVVVSDEKPGQVVDTDAMAVKLAAVIPTALDGDVATYLRAETSQQSSDVTRAKIQPLATQLDNLGNLKLNLGAEGVALVPTRKEILSWYTIVQGDAGELSLDTNESAVSTYLTSKAGKLIDVSKSLKLVVAALSDSEESASREAVKAPASKTVALTLKPKEVVTAGSYTLGRFEGKYVEVNISEQKAYRINGNTLEKVYKISSGTWSRPTPIGTFYVGSKHPRAFSRTYKLYMPYWQNLLGTADNGDILPAGQYGLHELPERPNGIKEGARSLGRRASHGCVRFGIGDAEEVYAWSDIGTKVVIH